jgi:hypothetical protein
MRPSRSEKLRPLLDAWEPHSVATTAHLKTLGITPQDLQNYTSSRWLMSLGRGAFKRPMETVTWQGALYSLQAQLRLPVHVGALTALEMSGNSHYVRFANTRAYLFTSRCRSGSEPIGAMTCGMSRLSSCLPNSG